MYASGCVVRVRLKFGDDVIEIRDDYGFIRQQIEFARAVGERDTCSRAKRQFGEVVQSAVEGCAIFGARRAHSSADGPKDLHVEVIVWQDNRIRFSDGGRCVCPRFRDCAIRGRVRGVAVDQMYLRDATIRIEGACRKLYRGAYAAKRLDGARFRVRYRFINWRVGRVRAMPDYDERKN